MAVEGKELEDEGLDSLPLGVRLQLLQQEGQQGSKQLPRKAKRKASQQPGAEGSAKAGKAKDEFREMSSKAHVSQRRDVIQLPKRRRLDPRFESDPQSPPATTQPPPKGRGPAAIVGSGKREGPVRKGNFFLKKSAQKREELVERFNSLKKSGGLEKAMAKRRKKLAAKDHRHLPTRGHDRQ